MADFSEHEPLAAELLVVGGMLLVAFPVFRTVALFIEDGAGLSLPTAILAYMAVLVVCFVYFKLIGKLMWRLHAGEPGE